MSRPDDSFERRFALEQAILAAPYLRFGTSVASDTIINVANKFLKFLKGET